MTKPVIYVLAGVNGAGKSSVGGGELTAAGMTWFNPDTFARDLVRKGYSEATANGVAWREGFDRLEQAIERGRSYAFETTLGGNTIPQRLRTASLTHRVVIWFAGLDSPEHHLRRIGERVARGGHDIPEAKVHERYHRSRANLIDLLPHLTRLQVYDNSVDAEPGQPMPDPQLVLQAEDGKVVVPSNVAGLRTVPDWAKPIVQASLKLSESR